MKTTGMILALILAAFAAAPAWAGEPGAAPGPSADELMRKAHLATYYAATDGIADVEMQIVNSRGKVRVREFTMVRLDLEEGGAQDYYTYFRKPYDVSRLTFMVHKLPGETDKRWLYVPSVDLVKRISADDRTSSFVGSDFTYEDVSGRHWSEDEHRLLREEALDGRDTYVIESTPRAPGGGFARKVSWVNREHFVIVREEYYGSGGDLERIYTAERVEEVAGVPTATLRRMEDVRKGQHTLVTFSNIRYDVGVDEGIFTERYLKNPPREYIR
ncbi:MAG: outer membrane lipoprotein-sorting protein [Candidatus Krumholzibacteriota bacterium]|nr:outer membrane lipoprotein-sorting protein [Candidatus Krumholzibacteriota bacterium]